MTWILDNFLSIGFTGLVMVAIFEMALRNVFPLFYFRHGLPIIWRSTLLAPDQIPLHSEDFQPEARDSKPYIEIQRLDEFEYALWPLRYRKRSQKHMSGYSPLTRGHITVDQQNNTLKLRIYLNWFAILFIPMWSGTIIVMAPWQFAIPFVILGTGVFSRFYHREKEQYIEIWDRACRELGLTA